MNILHLTASTFYGGPERQVLGLCRALADADRSTVVSFSEGGRCREFLAEARRQGVDAVELEHDTPRLTAAVADLAAQLERRKIDVLLCNGYKADLLGRLAARCAGVPAVAVSRGWTGENLARPRVRGDRPPAPALDGSSRLRVGGAGVQGASGRGAAGARARHLQRGGRRPLRGRRSERPGQVAPLISLRRRDGSSAPPAVSARRKVLACW